MQAKAAVDHVVDWLDATSTIKNLKLAPIVKREWARVLAGPVGEILSNMTDNSGRDLFRKSPIRSDVAAWVVKLLKLETGCECHRSEIEEGKHVDSWPKGRLLHVACDHAMKYLQDGVAEAGTWTRTSFGGEQDLLEEAVGLYRRTVATAKEKSASWMWCRDFSPDSTTMVRVLARFNRHLPQHHAITRLFFMLGKDLRRAVDDMAGCSMAPRQSSIDLEYAHETELACFLIPT